MKNSKNESDVKETPPAFRIWLCGPFRVERYVGGSYEIIRTADWGGSSYPRLLLKALLCCPGRQARREALMEMLWPDSDPEQAVHYLNTATTKLRKVLQPARQQEHFLSTEDDYKLYLLAGQRQLWADVDEAQMLLCEAERCGRMSFEALTLLEQATQHFGRGALLEEEGGAWVASRRATVERARYRCRIWLAEVYVQHARFGQAEMVLNALLEEDPLDEDVLCRLMNLLHQQGMTHQALKLCARISDLFADEGLELTEATRDLVAQLQQRRQYVPHVPLQMTSSHGVTPFMEYADSANAFLSQFTATVSREIVIAARTLFKEEMRSSFPSESRTVQHKVSADILAYKRNIRLALHLHRVNTAQGLLHDVNADIRDLEEIEGQVRGHDLYCVKEMLIANNLLAAKIVKDQWQYEHSYRYANNAVRVAKSLEDGDLIATTRYTRGCVKLEWAQFGTVKEGTLQLNKDRVKGAIHDFRGVLDMAHAQRTPLHPQLQGFTCLQLGRAYSLLHDTLDNSPETNPLACVDQAESMVGCDAIQDAYRRLVITGTISGLHWGAYHLNKTEIFIAMGLQNQALPELERLKRLTERTYAQDEIRNQAWGNVVMAEVMMGLEAYPEATSTLKSALLACRSINSIQNTATIIDIHSRLAVSTYGTSTEVQEIGGMLREWHGVASRIPG